MKFLKLPVLLMIFSMTLISCGGSSGDGDEGLSYTGNTSQATVDSENADELAVTSTSGGGMAVNSEKAPIAFRSTETSNLEELSEKIYLALNANRTANQTEDISAIFCDQGGKATATSSGSGNIVSVNFTGCRTLLESEIFIIDGQAEITFNNDDSFNILYKSFKMTIAGESFTFDGSIACDSTGEICSVSLDFVGLDGRVYRVQNVTISSTGVDSYDITATVYDPDYGYVSISGNVSFSDCASGVPSAGTITFSGAAGSEASISYIDCENFSVTFGGTTTDYLWAEIL